MPSERSSAGDPARTLELLWRGPTTPPRRGPERGLNLDDVVTVAIDLADHASLQAVTMRQVAQALDVATMTLYTYVPGKAELLDLMLDTAYLQMSRTNTTGQAWRQRLRAIAEENRLLFNSHPWTASISTLRPPLGPGLMAKYEHELSALEGLNLDDVEMDDALTYLLSFVQACARAAADAKEARHESAMNDEQWWATNAPLLARVLDQQTYPLATRVGTAAGTAHGSAHDPGHAYRFGLERVLDGLAILIDNHRRAGPSLVGDRSSSRIR